MKHEKEILDFCEGVWRTPTQVADKVLNRYSSSFASPKIKKLVECGKLEKHPRKGLYRTVEKENAHDPR